MGAIIPVKSLTSSKSRLAAVLSPGERALITQSMLAHVISTLRGSGAVSMVLVVSPHDDIRRIATILGGYWVRDTAGELNGAIELGMREAKERSAALLVIPSDLPRLKATDVRAVIDRWQEGHRVVICPSVNGGTNGLLMDASVEMKPSFGPGSFSRHLATARMLGLRPAVVVTSSFSFDLDTPDQWRALTREEQQRLLLGVQLPTTGLRHE